MKWYVIGSGAVGALVGSQLTKKFGLENVVLIDKNQEHIEAMRKRGLRVETKLSRGYRQENVHVNTFHPSEIQPREGNFILATKHYDTEKALEYLVDTEGPIISLQNGYNPELDRVKLRLIRGVIGFAISLVDNAHVRQTTKGEIYIGNLSPDEPPQNSLAGQLSTEHIPFIQKPNLAPYFFSKLIFNVTMNPLTTIMDENYSGVFRSKVGRQLMSRLYLEGLKVVKKVQPKLEKSMGLKPEHFAFFLNLPLIRATILNLKSKKMKDVESSMLQDIHRGLPTEIDYINGYLISLARQNQVQAPTHEKIISLVKQIESGRLKPSHKLAEMLLN